MSRESAFRKDIADYCQRELRAHVSNIESHLTSAGIPDMNIAVAGHKELWLELKVVKDGAVKMRPTQRQWHRARSHVGQSWVVVLDPLSGHVLVLRGDTAAALTPGVRAWEAAASIRTPADNFGWVNILLREYNDD